MKSTVNRALDFGEGIVARLTLGLQAEAGSLIVLYFHSLFESEAEIASGLVNPLEAITLGRIREVIENLFAAGYTFPHPEHIGELPDDGKYVILTSDDGYYNNVRWRILMREFNIPVLVFICTSPVLSGGAFWWDVVWRERTRRGASKEKTFEETLWLNSVPHRERDLHLTSQFGTECLKPISDLDRPFVSRELREFASVPGVCIGGHTQHHDNLCVLSDGEVEREISGSLADLNHITGLTPDIFSYPYGAWNSRVAQIAAKAGVRQAFTALHCRNALPVQRVSLALNRATIVSSEPVKVQCARIRSRFRLRPILSSMSSTRKHVSH